jgi:hypothetical protein
MVPTVTIYVRDDSAKPAPLAHRDPHTGKIEKYRRGTPEEERTSKQSMLAFSFEMQAPPTWPSRLKFREKPKVFNSRTGAGCVRKAEWLTETGWPKEELP